MSQNDFSLANADGATFRADLNAALQALASNNSGTSAPSTTYAYMWWADTTNGLLKQRNAANSDWITKGALSDSIVGLASQAEAEAGSATDKVMTPLRVSQAITALSGPVLGTLTPSTSGTAIDFTGIPADVRRITITFVGVSTNGSANLLVQLGDSGGIETTSYVSAASYIQNATANTVVDSTAGIIVTGAFATGEEVYGHVVLTLHDAATNSWTATGTLIDRASTTNLNHCGGAKALSGVLDRLRITTTNGTDTFDAGSINILYETGR